MSDWKTKSLEIVRSGFPAPFYEPTRVPVPPRKRDCVGEECPYRETKDCRPSRHHLFFEHLAYLSLGHPYDKLVKDPHAIVSIARCRHSSTYPSAWHNLYSYTELPKVEIAERWIEESEILQKLGVLIKDMSSQINGIFKEDPASRQRTFGDGKFKDKLEYYESRAQEYSYKVAFVESIEVIPSSIVGSVITNLGVQRNLLRSKAVEIPEFAKVQLARLPAGVASTGSLRTLP